MAKVATTKEAAKEFDYYLGYLEQRFSELEENDRDWDALSNEDKVDFLNEWSVVNVKLGEFQEVMRRYGVPSEYHDRYGRLQERIVRGQAIVARLWERA